MVPITEDESAFASVGDCEPLGLTAERLFHLLPDLVRDAKFVGDIGPKEWLPSYAQVHIREGALLRYVVADRASLMFLLHKVDRQMELAAIWPQLNDGGKLIAKVKGLIKSPDGTQAHAHLAVPDLPDHDLCVYLSEYAFGAGLWENGGKFDFRVIGLPLQVARADVKPILIGPDADSYASMIAAGLRPEPDGHIAFQQKGMAAFFPREDLAPHACEFRGTITKIGGVTTFFGTEYRIADVAAFRSDDAEVEHSLGIAISKAVWDDPIWPEIGDDIQGLALLQATAIGSIR